MYLFPLYVADLIATTIRLFFDNSGAGVAGPPFLIQRLSHDHVLPIAIQLVWTEGLVCMG
jgi:hypothetical protein